MVANKKAPVRDPSWRRDGSDVYRFLPVSLSPIIAPFVRRPGDTHLGGRGGVGGALFPNPKQTRADKYRTRVKSMATNIMSSTHVPTQ